MNKIRLGLPRRVFCIFGLGCLVAQGAVPGKAGKNNKHRPLNKHRHRKILQTNKGRPCDVRFNDQKYSSKDQF